MQNFLDVLSFHTRFDLPRGKTMVLMEPDAEKFRFNFLVEESAEFEDSWHQQNLVKTVDGLLDFVYVVIGTGLFIGCPRVGPTGDWPSFGEIRESTMRNNLVGYLQPPRLLPPGLQAACSSILKDRIDFFANAYQAARIGEERAMELSIYALKACCNTAYSIAAMMHVPWENCWRHVQEANMKKKRAEKDGSDSKRSTPWDVVKPNGWVAPEAKIAMELQLAGWRVPSMMLIDNLTGKVEMTK